VGQNPGEPLSVGTESQKLSGAKALAATIVLMIVAFISVLNTGPLVVLTVAVLTVIGLRSPSQYRRQLGAVGCAGLVWFALWALAAVYALAIGLGGNYEQSDFDPAIVAAVLGPVVGVLVLRRLWLRAG
jgi:hypothetical protein